MMKILILAGEQDRLAFSLYEKIKSLNFPAMLVTNRQLVNAKSWIHEIDEKGKASARITLRNGIEINSRKLKAVFNRIRFFSVHHFLNEKDRIYAENELTALYYSFMYCIRLVTINPVKTHDLVNEQANPLYLRQKAVEAGFSVSDIHFTSSPRWQYSKNLQPAFFYQPTGSNEEIASHLIWQNRPLTLTAQATGNQKVWVVGKNVMGVSDEGIKKPVLKLSRLSGKMFLEIDLSTDTGKTVLAHINLFPEQAPEEITETLAQLIIHYKKS